MMVYSIHDLSEIWFDFSCFKAYVRANMVGYFI